MKVLTAVCLVLALLACNEEKKDPVQQLPTLNDSTTRVRTERNLNPYATVDISPMDMSYFPVEYPKLKMSGAINEPPVARVVYSRPHLGGRVLFDGILKYDTTWRLGANESTEVEFYRDVTIQGKQIPAGRYVLYCIPSKESWTIVLNSHIDTWGLEQDISKDIARFRIPVITTGRHIEYFTIVFEKSVTGADLIMAWDNIEARLPIAF